MSESISINPLVKNLRNMQSLWPDAASRGKGIIPFCELFAYQLPLDLQGQQTCHPVHLVAAMQIVFQDLLDDRCCLGGEKLFEEIGGKERKFYAPIKRALPGIIGRAIEEQAGKEKVITILKRLRKVHHGPFRK